MEEWQNYLAQDPFYSRWQSPSPDVYKRQGAICVDFDLYGWGQSKTEYGKNSHQTDRAHVIQALNAEVLLLSLIHISGRPSDEER